jgi:hypothetical protein
VLKGVLGEVGRLENATKKRSKESNRLLIK